MTAPQLDPEDPSTHLRLFEATGIELEYMIVDRETLNVRPIADRVLEAAGGSGEVEVERGDLAWSNELALHVVELKTNGPAPSMSGLGRLFHGGTREIDAILADHGARLMPTGMHPWMDPNRELQLWPHEAGVIYQTFDRIFDCRGHGWANLQSMHINLPFADDDEMGPLHAAIRMILPILPALAASTPFADGAATGLLDTRLHYYRSNARRIPSVAGHVVPERVWTRSDYEEKLLGRIYRDLEPHDPEGVLRHEWANARGAIARFDRYAIEIRVLDLQECPSSDLAIASAVRLIVKALVDGELGDPGEHRTWSEETLGALFVRTVSDAEATVIDDQAYLRALGLNGATRATAGELWQHLIESTIARTPEWQESREPLEVILEQGSLARRLLRRLGDNPPSPDQLRELYTEVCDCLVDDRPFRI